MNIKPSIKTARAGEVRYYDDPMGYLLRSGLAVKVGNGLFVFNGILARLLEVIDDTTREIAEKAGADQVSVPNILSQKNASDSQYLSSFRNQAMMLCQCTDKAGKGYEGMASPTVCYHYFSSLRGRAAKKNHCVTAVSKCTRKEKGSLDDLSRLTNFTMREVVFLGTERYCLDKRDEILKATINELNRKFDLSYAVATASDPFFGAENEEKTKAQLMSESKYEVQAKIPFNDSTTSIASFNYHGNVFFKRFHIKPSDPENGFSGCVGWGYERILYALAAQKGVDFTSKYYDKLLKTKT